MYQKGRAWIELNMDHLIYNMKQIQAFLPPTCAIMPALKANAYGHGADLIGRALQHAGVTHFCVASVDEAIDLRKAGIMGQILILGYTSPYRFPDLVHYSLTQTAVDYAYARQLNDYGQKINVHAAIDTGMHRLGERCENTEAICRIWTLKNLRITGVFSHLSAADGQSQREKAFTLNQIESFNQTVDTLRRRGIDGFKTHIQGSYGILNYPFLNCDFARAGLALYGVLSSPEDEAISPIRLKPVLSLKARIASVKVLHTGETAGYGLAYEAAGEMKIAVLSIGYADGIPRCLSNKGHILVKGRKAPIIGRICMDQLLADVSAIPDAAAGDEAILIGKSGQKEIAASELAHEADTISNEILGRLGSRLNRIVYINKSPSC